MSKKKRLLLIFLMVIILLLGLVAMLYPMLASRYSASVQSEIRTEYEDLAKDTSLQKEYDRLLDAAHTYNRKLASGEYSRLHWEANGYYEQLRMKKTDVMGYIQIPSIDVDLPIYHGTSEKESLQRGVGHLEASSLPVGGESTHAVLSAHTGMANSRMFTDLELMVPGDIFYIDIMGETLAYQVMTEEDITIVLPSEISNISIEKGEDLITLVTCTPYGINSHRLLVKGHRITVEQAEEIAEHTYERELTDDRSSVWTQEYINTIINGILLSFLFCVTFMTIVLLLRKRDRRIRIAAQTAARAAGLAEVKKDGGHDA